jgi:hypothetical protein
MIQGFPELESTIYDEGVNEAYRYNQLLDRLDFANAGLERYATPGYFENVDLQRRLQSNAAKNIANIKAELEITEQKIGELIGVDAVTGKAIGVVAVSPYRVDN